MQRVEIAGRKFGKLFVLRAGATRGGKLHWLCRCDCGVEKEVDGASLRRGNQTSCGCNHAIANRKRLLRHGLSRTRTHNVWCGMKQRCLNPHSPFYADYGGRGITVCERWLNSFDNFLEDMGVCPPGKSIDRKDNDKGYSKDNCHWTTAKGQAANRRPRKKREA